MATFAVSTRVRANWKNRGTWYPGVISAANPASDSYNVNFDDGDFEANIPASRLTLADGGAPPASVHAATTTTSAPTSADPAMAFKLGDKVRCNWKNTGKWYGGVISKAESNLYSVDFNDGDKEAGIPPERLSRIYDMNMKVRTRKSPADRWIRGVVSKVPTIGTGHVPFDTDRYTITTSTGVVEAPASQMELSLDLRFEAMTAAELSAALAAIEPSGWSSKVVIDGISDLVVLPEVFDRPECVVTALAIQNCPALTSLPKIPTIVDLELNHTPQIPFSAVNALSLHSLTLNGVSDAYLAHIDPHGALAATLESLILDDSPEVTHIPRGLDQFPQLTLLGLARTGLADTPWDLGSIKTLKETPGIAKCPFVQRLPEEDRTDDAHVLKYLSMVTGTEAAFRSKLLVVGAGGIGKTTISNALTGAPQEGTSIITDTIAVRRWRVSAADLKAVNVKSPLPTDDPDARLDVSIWDFGGQPHFYEGHQAFLTDGATYLVLWDCDPNHVSDATGKEGRAVALGELREWLIAVEARTGGAAKCSKDTLVIIVGTKVDLATDSPAARQAGVQQAVREAGLTLPYESVEESVFDEISVRYVRQRVLRMAVAQSHIGRVVPAGYRKVRDYLRKEQDERQAAGQPPVVLFNSVAKGAEIEDRNQLTVLVPLLHQWSECVYFTNAGALSEQIFLDPEWIMREVIGALLSFLNGPLSSSTGRGASAVMRGLVARAQGSSAQQSQGRKVTLRDLADAWHGWLHDRKDPAAMQMLADVAALLEWFSLLFRRDDTPAGKDPVFFVPAALPILRAKERGVVWNPLCSRWFGVRFVVTGLVGQVLGALRNAGLRVDPDACWRSGVVVTTDEVRCVVAVDGEARRISVRAEARRAVGVDEFSPSTLLDTVHGCLSNLLSSKLPGLGAETRFECPRCLREGRQPVLESAATLKEKSVKRSSDKVLVAACSAHKHEVPLVEWFADSAQSMCKQHGATEHRFFASYRVRTDAGTAEAVCDALERSGKTCYLDRRCLVTGEDWRAGFLHGLHHSRLIVLIVSAGAMEQMRTAHEREDNVLLEWAQALQLKRERKAKLVPLLLGSRGQRFSAWDTSVYAEAPPKLPEWLLLANSTNVRNIVGEVMQLQGVFLDDANNATMLGAAIDEIFKIDRE